MKEWTIFGCLCALVATSQAQLETLSLPLPPSSSIALPAPPSATLPALDNLTFLLEDEADYALALAEELVPPTRVARPQEVSLNLNNSGTWETLPDGSRVWRLRIVSPNATDLWLTYDQWRIVKPCELFLYNDDRSMVLGPYTSIDNWDGTNVTPIVPGEAITLEYVVPPNQIDIGELSIQRVLHGYRHFFDHEARERDALDAFGDAMECMVNINCFTDYQDEKNSVALFFNGWGYSCTGALLNNTAQNGDPLFLTAPHCLAGNRTDNLIYFNYESATCTPNVEGNAWHVIANAALLMKDTLTENALLRISRPRPETAFIPRFEGWNRDTSAPLNSFGIHHPRGDVKKSHQDFDVATSTSWNGQGSNTHWRVQPDVGMAEPGSSGSPLFDETNRIVGPLHGGNWDCDTNTTNSLKYGKLAVAWEGTGSPDGRLRDWLDPLNSGATTTNAWQPAAPTNDSCGQVNVPLITTLPYSTSGSTLFAANNYSNTGCRTNNSPDVIYLLQLPCDRQVTVSTCGSSFDTQLFIYQVGACADVTSVVGCNDEFCGSQSQVSFFAESDSRYLIVLEGYDAAAGDFVLNISGLPCLGITPGPVVDLRIRPRDPDGNDVHLYWTPPLGAVAYNVYYSTNPNDIFNPANVVLHTLLPNAIVTDILDNGQALGFFGVIAIGVGG